MEERALECARRDNEGLFDELMKEMEGKTKEEIAKFWNEATDVMGNALLHVCAQYGSYDVMDRLFDVEKLECDPLTPRDKETPLHVIVRFANERDVVLGNAMAKMAMEAGCDPRVKDRNGRKPIAVADWSNHELRKMLGDEEIILNEGLRPEGDEYEIDPEDLVHDSASDSDDEVAPPPPPPKEAPKP